MPFRMYCADARLTPNDIYFYKMNVDKLSGDATERHARVIELMSTIETKFAEWAPAVVGDDYRPCKYTAMVYGGYVRDHIRHVHFGDDLRVADVDIGVWIHDNDGRPYCLYGRRDWDKLVREFLVPYLRTNGYSDVKCSERATIDDSHVRGYYCYTLKLTYDTPTGPAALSVDIVPRWLRGAVFVFDDFRCNRLAFGVDGVLRVDVPYTAAFTVDDAIGDIRDQHLVELVGRDHPDRHTLREHRIAKMTKLGYTLA